MFFVLKKKQKNDKKTKNDGQIVFEKIILCDKGLIIYVFFYRKHKKVEIILLVFCTFTKTIVTSIDTRLFFMFFDVFLLFLHRLLYMITNNVSQSYTGKVDVFQKVEKA